MEHDVYSDGYIRGILNMAKTIAMVGVSANASRPSYFAFKYLLERGYRMIPVNPGLAGKELLGQRVYANLAEIPEPVDMVDIFRASRYARPIVDEALKLTPPPQVIWMQLGVRDVAAAKLAEERGLKVVMNRCPKNTAGCRPRSVGWASIRGPSPRASRRFSAAASSACRLIGRPLPGRRRERPTAPGARTTAIADEPRARASAGRDRWRLPGRNTAPLSSPEQRANGTAAFAIPLAREAGLVIRDAERVWRNW